jgi:hypothetical protein
LLAGQNIPSGRQVLFRLIQLSSKSAIRDH